MSRGEGDQSEWPCPRLWKARGQAIRLLPLEAFLWGSNALPPQPRTRSDHALVWVTQGQLLLDLPRNPLQLAAGALRWLPAGTAFAARPQPGMLGHVLLITPELTRDLASPLPEGQFAASVDQSAADLLMLMRNLVILARQDVKPLVLARHLGLLAQALGRLSPEHPQAIADMPDTADTMLVGRFEALVRAELATTITISDLAQGLGCSTAALDRACLARRGQRAIDAVNQIRLDRAIALLRETRLSPMQIATSLGYASHAHFARAFAAATGRRPEIFRAQGC